MVMRQCRGGDIVSGASKLASQLSIRLKNWHILKHKYTGPFTELHKRLDENDKPLPGYEPFNQIDEIAMKHDICYRDSDDVGKFRSQCDREMLDKLDTVKTKGIRQKIDYAVVKPIIWSKYRLGASLSRSRGLGADIATELHKPIRHKFKKRRVVVLNIDSIWSADLKDMQSFSKQNKHYKYLLNVIDLFSRYAFFYSSEIQIIVCNHQSFRISVCVVQKKAIKAVDRSRDQRIQEILKRQ